MRRIEHGGPISMAYKVGLGGHNVYKGYGSCCLHLGRACTAYTLYTALFSRLKEMVHLSQPMVLLYRTGPTSLPALWQVFYKIL